MERQIDDDGRYFVTLDFRGVKQVVVRELTWKEIDKVFVLLGELLDKYVKRFPEESPTWEGFAEFLQETFSTAKKKIDKLLAAATGELMPEVESWPPTLTVQIIDALIHVNDDLIDSYLNAQKRIKKKTARNQT